MNKLTIEYLPLEDLKPYANNAKIHTEEQIQQIRKSIEEFGMNDPIAIWKDNEIIEGHGRLLACRKLGMQEVPVIRLDSLTDEQRRAYMNVHNQLTMNTGFDLDLLNEELGQIENIDMSMFGFNIDDFINKVDQEPVEDEYTEPEDLEPIVQSGQRYRLGDHILMCGDATVKEDVISLLDGKEVNLVFTDPPYGINVVSDDGKVGADFGVAKKGNYSKVISDETTDTAKASYEVLSGFCDRMIIWGGNYFLDFLPSSDGWIIWDKRVNTGIRNTFADGEMAYCSFHTPVRIYHQLWNGMIREGEHEKRVHPTQKPVKMLGDVLRDFTNENDVVIDVFGGSGSTLIACEQLGRKCYMMEYDPHYCDVIIDRWEKLTGKQAVKL